ncbi:transposase [Desemzia sp. C1]|uniref:transposase n=1 Tax=Desemzia TaxID=82800 RepID=UPI001660453F|nr:MULTISPECIES: transposase [Desemzia]MCI3029328.1 transposase [Desemzia sp. C1]
MPKLYDSKYKEYVCRMVVEENRKMKELSRELGLPYGTLRGWIREYKNQEDWQQKDHKKQDVTESDKYKTPSDYKKEIKEREKEIEKLAEENEILKKAMHVFTKNRE